MRTTLRWLGTIAAALLCVVAVGGCGGEDSGAPPLSNEEGDDGGGDGGAPPLSDEEADEDEGGDDNGDGGDGGDGGGVPGAPIDIPEITLGLGQDLDEVLPDIVDPITEQCGGEMCLHLEFESRDNDIVGGATKCDFVGTDPPAHSQVARGSTLIIIVGTRPCEPSGDGNTGDEPTDDEPTDDEPTGDGNTGDEPTDDEPTDDTEATTEGTL